MRLLPILAIVLCGLFHNVLAADRPNVLLIMADDLRDYGGAFTRDIVKTPNLDRLGGATIKPSFTTTTRTPRSFMMWMARTLK